MKLFFTVFFTFFLTLLSAQTYIPILADTNSWNELFCRKYNSTSGTYAIESHRDTFFHGHVYKALGLWVGYSFPNGTPVKSYMDYGLAREDTALKKIYATTYNDTAEYLIYDFDVSLGDTITIATNVFRYSNDTLSFRELMLDSVYVDSLISTDSILRFYDLNNNEHYYWLQGVGSLAGFRWNTKKWAYQGVTPPYNDLPLNYASEDNYALLCATKNNFFTLNIPITPIDNHYFSMDTCNVHFAPVSIEEKSPTEVSLFPNPVITHFEIIMNNPSGTFMVQVFDLSGKLIFGGNEKKIYTKNWKPGVYVVQVFTDYGVIRNKMVKLI